MKLLQSIIFFDVPSTSTEGKIIWLNFESLSNSDKISVKTLLPKFFIQKNNALNVQYPSLRGEFQLNDVGLIRSKLLQAGGLFQHKLSSDIK